MLDSVARRKPPTVGSGHRRALVHDQSDGLTINFNHDYPGGVTLNGPVTLTGDLMFTVHSQGVSATGHGTRTILESFTLSDIINSLRAQVVDLQARVAKLESK